MPRPIGKRRSNQKEEKEKERERERETATPAALFAAADKDDAVRGPAMQMAPIESTPSTASIRFVEINDAIDAISNRNGIFPPPTPTPSSYQQHKKKNPIVARMALSDWLSGHTFPANGVAANGILMGRRRLETTPDGGRGRHRRFVSFFFFFFFFQKAMTTSSTP